MKSKQIVFCFNNESDIVHRLKIFADVTGKNFRNDFSIPYKTPEKVEVWRSVDGKASAGEDVWKMPINGDCSIDSFSIFTDKPKNFTTPIVFNKYVEAGLLTLPSIATRLVNPLNFRSSIDILPNVLVVSPFSVKLDSETEMCITIQPKSTVTLNMLFVEHGEDDLKQGVVKEK